jgi:G3E family GTPase
MSEKIPVSVVSGFLGSGKTTFLNRVLSDGSKSPQSVQMAVIVNEIGAVGLDHRLVKHISDNVVLLESGCICCTVRGELVNALRDLFMAALHKKIPVFSRILIETTGLADPAPIIYTLRYERFLSERYRYDGCISVLDAVYGSQHLDQHPEAMQQLALADAIVVSKIDLASADELAGIEHVIAEVNPDAPRYEMQSLPPLASLLEASSFRNAAVVARGRAANGAQGFSASIARSIGGRHLDIKVVTLSSEHRITRSALIKSISQLQDQVGPQLLRIKGAVYFQGESQASVVHGVHQQLYPLESFGAELTVAGPGRSVLVLVLRGALPPEFEAQTHQLLFGELA